MSSVAGDILIHPPKPMIELPLLDLVRGIVAMRSFPLFTGPVKAPPMLSGRGSTGHDLHSLHPLIVLLPHTPPSPGPANNAILLPSGAAPLQILPPLHQYITACAPPPKPVAFQLGRPRDLFISFKHQNTNPIGQYTTGQWVALIHYIQSTSLLFFKST
ncbi:hypothetical protein BP00DRAFT_147219 [Aspergillus indologenus CBS 114.80]|uniref:Uncharacterized protein n=1 Tax=Aspergillus indologenus CBS 114.80 TaxID=1450541 RepID=A0A2V5I737_9EURO|nr:hypothetical protein BP00DRAFT_147219 [Aspergillus indologenus CBS 114.80]